MIQCKYSTTFENEHRDIVEFKCEEESIESGYCIFHDDSYHKKDPSDLRSRIQAKINNRTKGSILHCIGYNIPSISVKGWSIHDVIFSKSMFYGEANFTECRFRNVYFAETKFEKGNFQNAVFEDTFISFDNAIFQYASFIGAIFMVTGEFNQTTFHEVFFSKARFLDPFFYKARFLGETDFSRTVFSGNAYFDESVFEDETIFTDSQFDEAQFQKVIFNKLVHFTNARIHKAYFAESKFHGEASFYETQFDEATFDEVKFNGKTTFSAKFKDSVSFHKTEFNELDFSNTVINNSGFFEAEFLGSVDFFQVNFSGDTFFKNVVFQKEVDFIRTRFEKADFSHTVFNDKVNFFSAKIDGGYFYESIFRKEVKFNNVLLEKPEQLQFMMNDLSNISFRDTDVTRVTFTGNASWGEKDRFKIYDEYVFENNKKQISLEDIISEYRNLRENYEYNLRYDDAGMFFVREMNLRRVYDSKKSDGQKVVKNRWYKRNLSPLGLYFWLCEYGESYVRPFIWSIILIGCSTLFLSWKDNPTFLSLANYNWINIMGSSFYKSITAFVQFRSENMYDYTVRILSAPILGTLFIALRRKLERRFRH